MNRYVAFLKVLDLNSITKAAQTLGYTQSAVSQMIQSLEKELQLNLIRRSRNGVVLTEEGKKLLPYIERAVNEYHQLLEIDREILGLEDGLIRIGTLSSYSSQWLPRIIKEFQELYPRVRFRLRQGDYTTVPEYIRQGSDGQRPGDNFHYGGQSLRDSACRTPAGQKETDRSEGTGIRTLYTAGDRMSFRAHRNVSQTGTGAGDRAPHA